MADSERSYYGGDIIELIADDGTTVELEHVDTLEHEGETYMAFIPADSGEEDTELIILHVVENDGMEEFETVDDDELEVDLYTKFMLRIDEYVDSEDVEDEEDE